MIIQSFEPEIGEVYPPGMRRLEYVSSLDGVEDWALYLPGQPGRHTVIYMHGSFAGADQICTLPDVRAFWLSRIMAGGHPLISVNMRGTSYMSPAATADFTELLDYARAELGCDKYVLLGGSGGASSAMAYAVLHPEKLHGVIAMGMCDIRSRFAFAAQSELPVLQELTRSIVEAYGGTPEERPELYEARSVLLHADRLTMPIVLTMGECDNLIPVAETRRIAAALRGNEHFVYHEIPGGDHNSALWVDIDLQTLQVVGGTG